MFRIVKDSQIYFDEASFDPGFFILNESCQRICGLNEEL